MVKVTQIAGRKINLQFNAPVAQSDRAAAFY